MSHTSSYAEVREGEEGWMQTGLLDKKRKEGTEWRSYKVKRQHMRSGRGRNVIFGSGWDDRDRRRTHGTARS